MFEVSSPHKVNNIKYEIFHLNVNCNVLCNRDSINRYHVHLSTSVVVAYTSHTFYIIFKNVLPKNWNLFIFVFALPSLSKNTNLFIFHEI